MMIGSMRLPQMSDNTLLSARSRIRILIPDTEDVKFREIMGKYLMDHFLYAEAHKSDYSEGLHQITEDYQLTRYDPYR